jgi:hypothetical protein
VLECRGKRRSVRAKALKHKAFAPLGRNLLLRHKPRAMPWADILMAFQAGLTGQQYFVNIFPRETRSDGLFFVLWHFPT